MTITAHNYIAMLLILGLAPCALANDLQTFNDEVAHSEGLDTVIRLGTGGHPVDRAVAAAKEKMNEIMEPRLEKARAKLRSISERLGIQSDDSIGRPDHDDDYYRGAAATDEAYWKKMERIDARKTRLGDLAGGNADAEGYVKRLPAEVKQACDSVLANPGERSSCYSAYLAALPRTTAEDLMDERYPRNLGEAEDLCEAPSRREWTLQPVAAACREAMAQKFARGSDRLQGMLDDAGGRKAGATGLEGIMRQQQQQEAAAAEAARQAALARQRAEAQAAAARQAQALALQRQRAAEAAQQAAAQAQSDDSNGLAEFGEVVGAAMNALSRRAYAPSPAQPSRPFALGSQSGGRNGVGSQSGYSGSPPPAASGSSGGRICRAEDGCGIK